MAYVARMKKKYQDEVAPALMQKFQYKSVMQIPKIDKIVVSVGCGDCKDNAKALEGVIKEISEITGQHAVATVARKSVANFKLREGMKVGVKVTLRQDRMWEFLDRLFNVALPRVRDFRGISADAWSYRRRSNARNASFDVAGNRSSRRRLSFSRRARFGLAFEQNLAESENRSGHS